MITFLGLMLGQVLAILFQVARWVDDTRGWADYFRHRRHQGRHVADGILSVVIWFAWGTGTLAKVSELLPESWRAALDKLPASSVGPLVAMVFGFALAFVVRAVQKKYFDTPEPPKTAGDTPITPKGD